jgi:hypothetical protein
MSPDVSDFSDALNCSLRSKLSPPPFLFPHRMWRKTPRLATGNETPCCVLRAVSEAANDKLDIQACAYAQHSKNVSISTPEITFSAYHFPRFSYVLDRLRVTAHNVDEVIKRFMEHVWWNSDISPRVLNLSSGWR